MVVRVGDSDRPAGPADIADVMAQMETVNYRELKHRGFPHRWERLGMNPWDPVQQPHHASGLPLRGHRPAFRRKFVLSVGRNGVVALGYKAKVVPPILPGILYREER